MVAIAPQRIAINGVEYPLLQDEKSPVLGWELVQPGERVRWSMDDGLLGGVNGVVPEPGKYMIGRNIDTTTPPYIHLRPANDAELNLVVDNDLQRPFYAVRVQSGSTVFHYLITNRYIHKVELPAFTHIQTRTFTDGIAGRPVFFNVFLYTCWGEATTGPNTATDNTDIKRLDAFGAGAANDTWTRVNAKARHLSKLNDLGIMKMARAHTTNNIDLSPDGTTWTAGDFQIGDLTTGINDLHESEKGLVVFKPENVYEFDAQGNSRSLQSFVQSHQNIGSIGSNSFMLGQEALWTHRAGLFRVSSGGQFDSFGPDADEWHVDRLYDDAPFIGAGAFWASVTGYGRWLYATVNNIDTFDASLWAGFIERGSGKVIWHGPLFHANTGGRDMRCDIALGATDPVLWIYYAQASNQQHFRAWQLEADGSPRRPVGTVKGAVGELSKIFGPQITGTPQIAMRSKQWLKMGVEVESGSDDCPWQLGYHSENNSAEETLGDPILPSNGVVQERTWTPGLNDLHRYITPTISVTPTAEVASRIRRWWAEGRSLDLWRARIDLSNQEGFRPAEELMDALRDVEGKGLVEIVEPGKNRTFQGIVTGVTERWLRDSDGASIGYVAEALIERYDYRGG